MTHFELSCYLEGRGEAINDSLYFKAIHASWLMNVWLTKGKVTPDKLLGRSVSIDTCRDKRDFDNRVRRLKDGV